MAANNLKLALKGVLNPSELNALVRGYDVLGDVAIIIIPEELVGHEDEIAEAILRSSANLRIVAKRVGKYSGEYRTISLKIIGGVGSLETIHREFGVALHVDPEKVYFSGRSAVERYRIAKAVLPGERVLVMFSGIAPFPLMISKHSDASEIIGIEINPEAHRLAEKNLILNRKADNVQIIHGDVVDIIPTLTGSFDRVIMPLPFSSREFVDYALQVLIKNGWLHFYDFQDPDYYDQSKKCVEDACNKNSRELICSTVHKCGHVGPGRYRVCLDSRIS